MNTTNSVSTPPPVQGSADDAPGSASPHRDTTIREQLYQRVLTDSARAQLWLTLLTGKPHAGQVLPRRTPWGVLCTTVLAFVIGIAVSGLAVSSGGGALVLLPLGWVLTLHALLFWELGVIHHASHFNFVRDKQTDTRVGRALSILALLLPFDVYAARHRDEHHPRGALSTTVDPTVRYLEEQAGLVEGLPYATLKRRLWTTLLSPRFHLRRLGQRLRANLTASDPMTRWGSRAYLALMALGGVVFGWEVLLLAMVLPLTVFYEQSHLLRLIVEHLRDDVRTPGKRDREKFAELSRAVMMGSAPPAGRNPLQWAAWSAKMLGHLVVRLVVLPADSGVAHDYHHLHGRGDWINAIEARATAAAPDSDESHLYREVWGFGNAMKEGLNAIANSKR